MKILCTGDVHIGRPLSRIPDWYQGGRVPSSAAWSAIVDLAIREQVDLVAISGDLVDQANRYYEAISPVEIGVRALRAAGIPIVAVTGNHDFDVLPRIADRLDGAIQLLGRGGHWQRWTLLDDAGHARLHVDGWSFPTEHVRINPAHSYQLDPVRDAPVLGLLHADLDNSASEYAPVSRRDLEQLHPGFWLLGHIHAPSNPGETGTKPILYPGSPFALDPGESGLHGVVLVTVDLSGGFQVERRATAPIRYDRCTVDLTGATDPTMAATIIEDGVRAFLRTALAHVDGGALELLIARVVLVGRVKPGLNIDNEIAGLIEDFRYTHGTRNSVLKIEEIDNRTTPEIDLDLLAAGIDAPAAIARTLLSLQDDASVLRKTVIDGARARAQSITRGPRYRELPEPDLSDSAMVAVIEQESWLLLDALVAQKGAN
ncbi:DNA repair exonuclease [soil metagenome]